MGALEAALEDWHPHVAAGAEQQAPVVAFGVGSPQHGLAGAASEDVRTSLASAISAVGEASTAGAVEQQAEAAGVGEVGVLMGILLES